MPHDIIRIGVQLILNAFVFRQWVVAECISMCFSKLITLIELLFDVVQLDDNSSLLIVEPRVFLTTSGF